jgi:hypothetical protein
MVNVYVVNFMQKNDKSLGMMITLIFGGFYGVWIQTKEIECSNYLPKFMEYPQMHCNNLSFHLQKK